MARVPIIRVGDILLATIQEDLHDSDALALQESLTTELERTGANGVLLDFTTVQTVDSFLGRMLNDVVAAIQLLGATTVVVGIQPAVAMTLVELGLELKGIRTALDAERGMRLLGSALGTSVREG
ncbi:MAG: STAS domain-containing protein [Chloroflexota bacterium]